jgi:ABC-type sugar transport system substrate-binding protein
VAVLMLVLAGALALSARGGTDNTRLGDARAGHVAGGFGEVYKANPKTLAKTLFSAKLLPGNAMAKNISLAAYRRADMKVNYNLALKCWKNNGCSTGTGGKLTVAYVEGFGENVYRQVSKMEFILQALTYPQIGKIIYTSAHSDLNQALADFRAVIAQHVSAIVTYPDFGDAMIPVFKEATAAGIPVSTYAWGFVSGPGTNYTTVVGEDTCKLGKAFAKVMNTQVKSGDIAFLGGFPGNPLSLGWQNCEKPALNSSINVVANEPTNWDPS